MFFKFKERKVVQNVALILIFLHQDSQSDLEVILEFLGDYYRQNTSENGKNKNTLAIEPFKIYIKLTFIFLQQSKWTGEQLKNHGITAGYPTSTLYALKCFVYFHETFKILMLKMHDLTF